MKKALILAMAITLVLTGSLFAQGRRLVAEPNATFVPGVGIGGVGVAAAGPTTTNNDDTCDISVTPAATLLLPYFEVNQTDRNTIFTIVNTSPNAQIAHVTLWTDWSFPVLDFNIFLTGYDVQGISLRDVIFNAVIAPTATPGVAGTTDTGLIFNTATGTGLSPYGPLSTRPTARASGGEGANPNFAAEINCTGLPGSYPLPLAQAIQNALINGVYSATGFAFCDPADRVGSAAGSTFHPANTAVGYVTIDVADSCTLRLPTDPEYFASDILFDNVLTGDYETFDASAASNYAGGTPLVHIRAIPEGGPAGFNPGFPGVAFTNLPYTFYSRYADDPATVGVNEATRDRRQPLPAQWAARFTAGGGLATSFKIWREGVTGSATTTCEGVSANANLTVAEVVRFDEHENPSTFAPPGQSVSPTPPTPPANVLPEAARVPVQGAGATGFFPAQPTAAGDVGGWMFMNLDFGPTQNPVGGVNPLYPATAANYGAAGEFRPAQSWVVVSMTGTGPSPGALAVDFDATWLANGCTNARTAAEPIGPPVAPTAANQTPNFTP